MKKNLFLSFLFSSYAFAGSHLMVIGGGGEAPNTEKTIFDQAFNNFGDYYKKASWDKTALSFNGGHGKLENIISNKLNKPNTPFTNDSYNTLIKNYADDIKSGKISSGDKILIYIDTHGAVRIKDEKTHSISTSGEQLANYNTLGSSLVSLDKLKELTELAKSKGIKLGIVDFSCHSGNSLTLANENTCVITSTGPNHYAYGDTFGTFSEQFTKNMAPGKSLEDVFLTARLNTTDRSFPMISTPQNDFITKYEYKYISPYLFSYDPTADKFSDYILEAAANNLSCTRANQFQLLDKLINFSEKITNFTTPLAGEKLNLSSLKKNLAEYKAFQDSLIDSVKNLNVEKLKKEEEIFGISGSTLVKQNYSWKELALTNFDELIQMAQNKINQGTNLTTGSYEYALLDFYRKGKQRKNEILNQNPGLTTAMNLVKNYDTSLKKSEQFATKIAMDEKKLFNQLYKGQDQKGSNACKDFKL